MSAGRFTARARPFDGGNAMFALGRRLSSSTVVAVVVGMLSGCDSPSLTGVYGDLQISADPPEFGETATLRFDEALGGVTANQSVWLRNAGRQSVTILAPTHRSGDSVLFAARPDANHSFALDIPVGRELRPNETIELQALLFASADTAPHQLAAEVSISASDTAPGRESVLLRLEAQVLPSPCKLPESIDFGLVLIGQEETRSLVLSNPTSTATDAQLGAPSPQDGDGATFSYKNGGPGAALSVPAGGSRELLLGFQPSEARPFQASIDITVAPGCQPSRVLLIGEGRSKLLEWDPPEVECGFVLPGRSVSREVRFTSSAQRPVELSSWRVVPGQDTVGEDFALPASSWGSLAAFVLEPGESLSRTVTCTPTSLGEKSAALVLATDLQGQEEIRVPLAEIGGGPRIEVFPEIIDFGTVAFVAGAALSETRELLVTNSGEAAPEHAEAAALHLGTAQANGDHGAPFIHVEPLTPETSPDEIELVIAASPSIAPAPFNNNLTLPIRLTPKSAGIKHARVEILSNDPERPRAAITVSAVAKQMPACEYRVSPSVLDFGVVQATAPKTMGFSFENLGQSPDALCLLTVEGITSGALDYSLPKAVQALEVAPGQKVAIPVTLKPRSIGDQSYSNIPGLVALRVSSPSAPEPAVVLQGGTGPACLALQPTELDFGALRPGEQSAERVIQILHLCAPTVKLHGVTIGSGAPQFQATLLTEIPADGIELENYYPKARPPAPELFPVSVRFAPQAPGEYLGSLVFEMEHRSGRMRHVLPLRGRAEPNRINVTSFQQEGGDSVDILLYLESGADGEPLNWPEEQIAARVPALLNHLSVSGNDFQIGVLRFCLLDSSASEWGTLSHGPQDPDRILRPTTAGLSEKLQQKIGEPQPILMLAYAYLGVAWFALTPPVSTGANAGFLRSGARFAFIHYAQHLDSDITSCQESPPFQYPYREIGQFAKAMTAALDGDEPKMSSAFLTPIRDDAGQDPHCRPPSAWFRYMYNPVPAQIFTAVTPGGFVGEACPARTSEFDYLVERIAEVASGLRTHFPLPTPPDLAAGPIEVTVDGVAVPSTDAQGELVWEYLPERNAVHFPVAKTPRPGQKVVLRYTARAP